MALTDGLIALYHMNNDWQDAIGNNHGIPYGATFDGTDKKLGSHAGSFEGIDDYVTSANNLDITGNNARSIGVWFKLTGDGSAAHGLFLWRYGIWDYGQLFGLAVLRPGNYFTGQRNLYFTGVYADLAGTAILSLNTWYHVIVTYAGDTMKFYLNGSLDTSQSLSLNTGNSLLNVGLGEISGGWGYHKGFLDELVVWNRAISESEVSELYNNGAGMEIGEVKLNLNPFIPKAIRIPNHFKAVKK